MEPRPNIAVFVLKRDVKLQATNTVSAIFLLPVLGVSVTLVYCGQTVGWIRMPLGLEVGLGLGDIVLDGDPAPPTERCTTASTFRTISSVARRLPISAAAELLLLSSRHRVSILYNVR